MTKTKKAVALDVFLGEASHVKTAQKHSISYDTLRDWLKHPEFRAYLDELRQNMVQSLFEQDVKFIAKEHRLVGLSRKAESAAKEYDDHTWREEQRFNPTGPPITNRIYNREAFDAFRGALDDIAKELGERRANSTAVSVSLSLPQILEMGTTDEPPPVPIDPYEARDANEENSGDG